MSQRWSRTVSGLFVAVWLCSGCGPGTGDSEQDLGHLLTLLGQSGASAGFDADVDGIDDALEDALAARFAPELRLAPYPLDAARPANVDWYLERVHMRFHHAHCPDCRVVALGAVTQANLSQQSHQRRNAWCGHSGARVSSSASQPEFFLQASDDRTHRGTTEQGWRTYVRVRRSLLVSRGYDVQYWFFYPYNNAFATLNHEGDWEHITVTVDAGARFHSAWYAQHAGGRRFTASDLTFVGDSHPVVYVARGTHASYPEAGSFDLFPMPDITVGGGPIWKTWTNWTNVGERGAPRNGQRFIEYGGRWGEIGVSRVTRGPRSPTFQTGWDAF